MRRSLLRHNCVHFLATDAHRPDRRPPILSRGRDAAAGLIGEEKARRLVEDNPLAVVRGQPITIESPVPYEILNVPDSPVFLGDGRNHGRQRPGPLSGCIVEARNNLAPVSRRFAARCWPEPLDDGFDRLRRTYPFARFGLHFPNLQDFEKTSATRRDVSTLSFNANAPGLSTLKKRFALPPRSGVGSE